MNSSSEVNILYCFVHTSKYDFNRGHWLKKTLANHFVAMNESHEISEHKIHF